MPSYMRVAVRNARRTPRWEWRHKRGRAIIVEPMVRAKESGRTRFLGYSGDNEAAQWAVNSGVFDTLQTKLQPGGPAGPQRPVRRGQGQGGTWGCGENATGHPLAVTIHMSPT